MERDPLDPRIEYEFLSDPSPSEADGRFLGLEWCFYARWDNWYFAIAYDKSISVYASDWRDLPPEEIPTGIFFRQGTYPGRWAASYMTKEAKQEIIRKCMVEFERERLNNSNNS